MLLGWRVDVLHWEVEIPFAVIKLTMEETIGMKMDAVATLLLNSVNAVTMVHARPMKTHSGSASRAASFSPIKWERPLFSTPAKRCHE